MNKSSKAIVSLLMFLGVKAFAKDTVVSMDLLIKNQLDISIHNKDIKFNDIYGDGTTISKGIPLFIFNYIDYKLWENYADIIRGKSTTEGDSIRNKFFNLL